MSEGSNKRLVKKSNTGKMSIKISTEDKETPSSNKISKGNTKSIIISKSIIPEENPEMSLSKLLEDNQNLQKELEKIKGDLKSEKEKSISDIDSINKELEELNKTQNNVCKKNKVLMNKLKKIEEKVNKQFDDKFKISKVIENQQFNRYNKDIKTEILSKENEKNNVQKDIKINQKEIDRLNKIIEENNEEEGGKLEEQYKSLEEDIEKIQKELNDLHQLKLEHKSCSKNASILQSKLNVLNNDIDFELKKKMMFSTTQEKKIMTIINEENKRNSYGKRIRNNLLQSTDNKYDFKNVHYVNHKTYNYIKNQIYENEKEKLNNLSDERKKEELEEGNIGNNKKKNEPNFYLFTDAEKEVFKKIIPNDLFNNLNEKYNQKETEMKEIRDTYKEPEELKKIVYLDNLKYEEINLKQKEMRMIKANLMSKHIKNNKKITEIKNNIKMRQKEIDKENKKINRFAEQNHSLKEIIKKYIAERKGKEEKKEINN